MIIKNNMENNHTRLTAKLRFSTLLLAMVVVLTTLLSSSVIADQTSLPPVKQGDCALLQQTCDSCTFVNISSVIHNNQTLLSNVAMFKDGTFYFYTFCNTTSLGEYIYNTVGDPMGNIVTQPVNFNVTPSGFELTTANTVIMFFILAVLVLITIVMYGFGLTNKNKPLKFFFLSLSVLLTMFIIGLVLVMSNIGIGEFANLNGVFNSVFILGTILLGAGVVAGVVYVIKYSFEQFYKSKGYEFGDMDLG